MTVKNVRKGGEFETIIKAANAMYRKKGEARIDKYHPPFFKNKQNKWLFGGKSTVDFGGVVAGGRFIAFDAKTVQGVYLPLKNVEIHQIEYLQEVNRLGGVGFLLIWLKGLSQYWFVEINADWRKNFAATKKINELFPEEGKRSMNEEDLEFFGIKLKYIPGVIDYLPVVRKIIEERNGT